MPITSKISFVSGFLTGLKLAKQARLGAHRALGICLSLSPPYQDYKYTPLCQLLCMDSGIELRFSSYHGEQFANGAISLA